MKTKDLKITRNRVISAFIGLTMLLSAISAIPMTAFATSATCGDGGVITPPSATHNVGIINGNILDGSSSRPALNVNVLDLISGTCIKANEIYGIEAITFGEDRNRQAYINVNDVASPMFHGSSTVDATRINAIMSNGNISPRTPQNTLPYMNMYGGSPKAANNVITLAPFVSSVNPARFDVRIRSNQSSSADAFCVTSINLLGANGEVLGTSTYSTQSYNGTWSAFVPNCDCCEDCGKNPCECTDIELPDCGLGGIIAPPTNQGTAGIRVINGNSLAGTSGNDASRRVLNVDVKELISGTCIKANDVYGIEAITFGDKGNRQVYIDVRTSGSAWSASPQFHGSSSVAADTIQAIMIDDDGNESLPTVGITDSGRMAINKIVYMNQYGGSPKVASNMVSLAPFVGSESPEKFDVRIRANNDGGIGHCVISFALLDVNGKVLGTATYSSQDANGIWDAFAPNCECNDNIISPSTIEGEMEVLRNSYYESVTDKNLEVVYSDGRNINIRQRNYLLPEESLFETFSIESEPNNSSLQSYSYSIGDTRDFYLDYTIHNSYDFKTIQGNLIVQSDHANIWILDHNSYHSQSGIRPCGNHCNITSFTTSTSMADEIALKFDNIYTAMTNQATGFAPHQGIIANTGYSNVSQVGDLGEDGKVNILLYDIGDTGGTNFSSDAGFFTDGDFYAYYETQTMNNLDMIHMDISDFNSNSTESTKLYFYETLAHEFQHLLFYMHYGIYQPQSIYGEDIWINETLAEMAAAFYTEFGTELVNFTFLRGAANNQYNTGTDFINFDGSLKSYGMARMFAHWLYKTNENFATKFYNNIREELPVSTNRAQLIANTNKISNSGDMRGMIGNALNAGTNVGTGGNETISKLYFLFTEAFGADGGLLNGDSYKLQKMYGSSNPTDNLWAIRPVMGVNGGRVYNDSSLSGFYQDASTFASAIPNLNSGASVTASGAREQLFKLTNPSISSNTLLNITVPNTGYGNILYYLLVPQDDLVVSGNATYTTGASGANIYSLIKGVENKIDSMGKPVYLLVVTFEENVNARVSYEWKPPIVIIGGEEYLKNSTSLDLSNKYLDGSDLRRLNEFPNLTHLNLSNNQIRDISYLEDLVGLIELNLSNNLFSDLEPLEKLTNLTMLNLSCNAITSDLVELLQEDLPGCNIIFNNNRPPFITIHSRQYSVDLLEIGFYKQGLSNIEFQKIRYFTNLRWLNFTGNIVDNLEPISELIDLEFLKLSINYITDLEPISELKNLKHLDLSYNYITDISTLSGLENLEYLSLRNNYQITDLTPLSNLVNLQELDLTQNSINDISALMGLTNLTHLDLTHNPLTLTQINTLQSALPNCTIIHNAE